VEGRKRVGVRARSPHQGGEAAVLAELEVHAFVEQAVIADELPKDSVDGIARLRGEANRAEGGELGAGGGAEAEERVARTAGGEVPHPRHCVAWELRLEVTEGVRVDIARVKDVLDAGVRLGEEGRERAEEGRR
jgi:hypothetical protein